MTRRASFLTEAQIASSHPEFLDSTPQNSHFSNFPQNLPNSDSFQSLKPLRHMLPPPLLHLYTTKKSISHQPKRPPVALPFRRATGPGPVTHTVTDRHRTRRRSGLRGGRRSAGGSQPRCPGGGQGRRPGHPVLHPGKGSRWF